MSLSDLSLNQFCCHEFATADADNAIDYTDKGYWAIFAYDVDNGVVMEYRAHAIRFCPFCGKPLQEAA